MMMFNSRGFSATFLVLVVRSVQAQENDASCDSKPAPASLLQKDVRRHAKSSLSERQPEVSECTGSIAQERCWYLSDLGKNCADTCTRYGHGFAFAIADPQDAMMPKLVGHVPAMKQDAWAALECYAPDEDRYHPANEKAAKRTLDEVAKWSHENCQLACPCSLTDVSAALPAKQEAPVLVPVPVPTPAPAPVMVPQPVPVMVPAPVPVPVLVPAPVPVMAPAPVPVMVAASAPVPALVPSSAVNSDALCSWKQPAACAPEFSWKGITYTACADVDSQHDRPWCQHHYQHSDSDTNPNLVPDWSYCSYSCESEKPTLTPPQAGCGWGLAPSCAKEFDYEGAHYIGCATVDHATPWCANSNIYAGSWAECIYQCAATPLPVIPVAVIPAPVQSVPVVPDPVEEVGCGWSLAQSCAKEFDYEGAHYIGCTTMDHATPWCANSNPYAGSWAECIYQCAATPLPVIPEPVIPVPVPPVQVVLDPVTPAENTVCTWQAKQQCKETFEYKGVAYTGCTDEDHPTPWCSHDSVHQGSWTPCSRVCVQQTLPVPPQPEPAPQAAPQPVPQPVPQPPVPVLEPRIPDEDPCTRHPEAENDLIGTSVTLDEAGYKIAASADSPINMKRFICRTVSEISCRVTDVSSLMAFVPFYNGLVSHQTYSALESELTTLCHAGGQWLVPIRNP